ncbi:MAG: hypothetical protein WC650_02440 [Candidatus Doudnabacteria bacterium]
MGSLLERPLVLVPSVFPHCYQGGKLRAQFFGEPSPRDDRRPEGWFLSTNKAMTPGRTNEPHEGIGRVALPGGGTVLLTELIAQFPAEMLGPNHLVKWGQALGILVKIFDTASYIPVHWHPDRKFAQKYLNSPFGKTEAWIIIATRRDAKVWVGWDRQITRRDITEWYRDQNGNGMRSCMFIYEPEIGGDIFYIPAGVPHSLIGCCVLEPQEPTDWSIFAEWKMLGLPRAADGLLGLDWETALDSLDFSYFNKKKFESEVFMKPRTIWTEGGNNECDILPENTGQFFGASRLTVNSEVEICKEGFYGIAVTSGSGYLKGFGSDLYLKPGVTLMMPACLAGHEYTIVGNPHVQLFFFYPPLS